MKSSKKRVPVLKTDKEAESFLEKDLSNFIHEDNFQPVTFEFAPKAKVISLRLSEDLYNAIRKVSKKRHMNYQKYIRHALEEALRRAS